MTVSKKEQERRDDQKREALVSKLYMKLSFNDWKQAAEIGINREDIENDEFASSIMLAHKADPSKAFEELADMGLGELNKIIYGDLMPKELEVDE